MQTFPSESERLQARVFVRQLGTDVTLGWQVIDNSVDDIQVEQRIEVLLNGDTVPTVHRRAASPRYKPSLEHKTTGPRARATQEAVRCAVLIVIPATSEATIIAASRALGTRVIDTYPNLYDVNRIAVANSLSDIQP